MQATKITYWISTLLISFMMLFSAYAYLTKPEIQQAFLHLGFPSYFRIELAIAKFLGVLVLLTPVAARIKEWAYAGFAITFISAIIAHTASGDPVTNRIMPGVALLLLITSYICYHRKAALPATTAANSVSTAIA